MTSHSRTRNHVPVPLFIALMGIDALVYAVGTGRIFDALVVVAAAGVACIPRVRHGRLDLPLLSAASCLALTILQWPHPELWCLNLALAVHVLALWRGRNVVVGAWRWHAFIVAGTVVLWYCLESRSSGWAMAVLTVLGAAAIVGCWLALQSGERRSPTSYALLLPLITPVTGALVIGITMAEPVMRGARHAFADDNGRRGPGGDIPKKPGQRDGLDLGYTPGDSESQVIAYVALRNPPSDPDQFKPPIYLREEGFSIFTGRGWVHASRAREDVKDIDDGRQDGWTRLTPAVRRAPTQFKVYIPDVRSSLLPTLPGTTALDIGSVSVAEDGGYHVVSRRGGFISYRGMATIHRHEGLSDDAMEPGDADLRYYDVPEMETLARLEETTTRVLGDASSAAEKIRRISTYVATSHTYLLQTDKTRATLTNFLYGEKKGHCTLFATATTMMLRLAGIPARVAVGFCGAKFDPRGGVFVFDKSGAHAWTEYKTNDHGWVILDTTPPESRPGGIANDSDFSANAERYSSLEDERVKETPIDPLNEPVKAASPQRYQNLSILFLFAAVAALYLLTVRRGGAFSHDSSEPTFTPVYKPITDFFKRFCSMFAAKGTPRRRCQTAAEYLGVLKGLGHVADEWDDMIAYYYAVCYEGAPPSREREDDFLARVEALAAVSGNEEGQSQEHV